MNLKTRIEPLEIVLSELDPDIIVLTEHKLSQNEIHRLNIQNYIVIAQYSRSTTVGGGVVILSKERLGGRHLISQKINGLCQDKLFECCVAKFKVDNHKFLLAGIYRKPQFKTDEFLIKLNSLIDFLTGKEKHIILTGDFNIDILKNSKESRDLINILQRHGLTYLVDFPTRVTATSQTCLDNFFTNIDLNELKISGVLTYLSDHDGQILELLKTNVKVNKSLKIRQRSFSPDNMQLFKSLLENEDWLAVYCSPTELKYDCFNNIFKYHFDHCFPVVTKFIKKTNWITEDLKEEKKHIIQLSKLARDTKSDLLKNKVKTKNKQYNLKLVERKKLFFDNKIKNSENINKVTWQIINNETKRNINTHESNIVLKMGHTTICEPFNVSCAFNDYFINVVDDLLKGLPPSQAEIPNVQTQCSVKFQCPPVTEDELDKIIDSLANKWSSGYDEVPFSVIKYVKLELVKPLTHLINSSLITGLFPNKLKIAKVVPIYKKGSPSDIQNYRPVSILPSISKLFERAMYNRLLNHLETNSLFDIEQHGFRKNKSTVTALVAFTESIIDSVDKKDMVTGIFMDLTRAFDSISHSKLLHKLNSLGVHGIHLKWFESYLCNRQQYVEVNHINNDNKLKYQSNLKTITNGVPQGSILGPLLFICYMRHMPKYLTNFENIKNQLFLYADDSNLIISAKTGLEIEITAYQELSKLQDFFIENSLILNTNKTNTIFFQTKQNRNHMNPSIQLNETVLNQQNCITFLGLIVDRNLSWDVHVNHIVKKINSGLYAIKRLSCLVSLPVLKMVFHSHVQSHIAYGISVYGGTSDTNLKKILILQKKSLRIILKLANDTSVKKYFTDLRILTIYSLYILECVMYVRSNQVKLKKYCENHNYDTRNKNENILPQHNLTFFTKKTSFNGIKFLKCIPNKIKEIKDNKKFKKLLKEHLIKKAYYSFEEMNHEM